MLGKIVPIIMMLAITVSIAGCGEEETIGTPRIAVTEYFSYCDVPDSAVFIANDSCAYLLDKATGEVSVCCDGATAVSAYGDELLIYQLSQDRIIDTDGSLWCDLIELDSEILPLRSFEVGYDDGENRLYATNVFGTTAVYSLEDDEVVYENSFDVPLFDGNKINGWIIITEQDDGNVIHELSYKQKDYTLFNAMGSIACLNENNYLLNPDAGIFACDAGSEVFLLRLDDETKTPLPIKCDLVALYSDCIIYKMNADVGTVINIADFDGNVLNEFTFDDTVLIIPDTYERKLYLVDLDSMTADTIDLLIK